MDHHYIKEHFIIERFIDGDLERDLREQFFQHCLECPECCSQVHLAGEIESFFFEAGKGYKEVLKPKEKKSKSYLLKAGVLLIILVAFWLGYLLRPTNPSTEIVKNLNENQQPTIQTDGRNDSTKSKAEKSIEGTTNGSGTKSNNQSQKESPQKQELTHQIPVSTKREPDDRHTTSKDALATYEESITLQDVNSRLQLGAEMSTKGSRMQLDDKLLRSLFEEQSDVSNSSPNILKPLINQKFSSDKEIEISWETSKSQSICSIILIDRNSLKVVKSFARIKGKYHNYMYHLPPGSYYLLVFENDTKPVQWSCVKFEVRK